MCHRNVRTTEHTKKTRGSATFTCKGLLRQPHGAISERGTFVARTNAFFAEARQPASAKVQASCIRRLIAIYAESSKRGRAAMTAMFALQRHSHVCCTCQATGRQAALTVFICVAGSGRSARIAKRRPAQNTSTVAEPSCLGFCNRHVCHRNIIELHRDSR